MADAELEPQLRAFCAAVGAPDITSWLGLPKDSRGPTALHALERKRLALEAGMADPLTARQAELLTDHYDLLRTALGAPSDSVGRPATVLPDYYAALAVPQSATFGEIEAAWRARQSAEDPIRAQAWRVLASPVSRAAYDRSRRQQLNAGIAAEPFRGDVPSDVTHAVPPPPTSARLEGPATVHLTVTGRRPTELRLRVRLSGAGPVVVRLATDDLSVQHAGDGELTLSAGLNEVRLRVDPAHMPADEHAVAINLRGGLVDLNATIVLHRHVPRVERSDIITAMVAGAALVVFGWWLGARMTVATSVRTPSSIGDLSQIPAAIACVQRSPSPLPRYVDIYTDGMGRTTGFQLGGTASPTLESCMKEALLTLELPPTVDGLPAFHRYNLSEVPP